MMIPHKKSLIEFLRYFPGLEKRGPIDFERRFLQEKVDRVIQYGYRNKVKG